MWFAPNTTPAKQQNNGADFGADVGSHFGHDVGAHVGQDFGQDFGAQLGQDFKQMETAVSPKPNVVPRSIAPTSPAKQALGNAPDASDTCPMSHAEVREFWPCATRARPKADAALASLSTTLTSEAKPQVSRIQPTKSHRDSAWLVASAPGGPGPAPK